MKISLTDKETRLTNEQAAALLQAIYNNPLLLWEHKLTMAQLTFKPSIQRDMTVIVVARCARHSLPCHGSSMQYLYIEEE